MKTIYFTRHGQTIWNVENKICGATDIDLTPLGHEQAITLGNLLKEENYPPCGRATIKGAKFRTVRRNRT